MARLLSKQDFAVKLFEAYGNCVNASISQLCSRLGFHNRTTMHKYLHELVAEGILQVEGAGTCRQLFIFNREAYNRYVNG